MSESSEENAVGEKGDPARPWGADPVLGGRKTWQVSKETFEKYLLENGLGFQEIDELALMFSNERVMWNFIEDAVQQEGVELFNVAIDTVDTFPLDTSYEVMYAFLRVPEVDFRLELMAIQGGYSPLHSSVAFRIPQIYECWPVGVHMSFKMGNESDYEDLCDEMVTREDLILTQDCLSDYGRFSYWKVESLWGQQGTGSTYLKPRCNTRDEALGVRVIR